MVDCRSSFNRCFDFFLDRLDLLFEGFDRIQRLPGFSELRLERVDISSQYSNFELTFGPGFGQHFTAFIFDRFQPLFEILRLRFEPIACFFQFLALARRAVRTAAMA